MENKILIIIPCLNEERYLTRTLPRLKALTDEYNLHPKIILADNGSKDNSVSIAKKYEIIVKISRCRTVGALRNFGVNGEQSDILVFLDADVEITPQWCQCLTLLMKKKARELYITGFPCFPPPECSLLEKVWYSNPVPSKNYINSGNLITTFDLFKKINGFNQKLITGEDYDFCQRALGAGAIIKPDRMFVSYHHGYPKTLKSYFLREWWHGGGDYASFQIVLQSKPALAGLLIATLTMLWPILILFYPSILSLFVFPAFIFFCGMLFALKKTMRFLDLPVTVPLAILYFYARALSVISAVVQKVIRKKTRWR